MSQERPVLTTMEKRQALSQGAQRTGQETNTPYKKPECEK